jgi:hypothetical protein
LTLTLTLGAPTRRSTSAIKAMLRLFGQESGLQVNYAKSSATLLNCDAEAATLVMGTLGCPVAELPLTWWPRCSGYGRRRPGQPDAIGRPLGWGLCRAPDTRRRAAWCGMRGRPAGLGGGARREALD